MSTKVEIREFRIEDLPLSCTWLWIGPPGSGKCLGEGTQVLTYEKNTKSVESVKVNDILLGDDLTPRKVMSTTSGEGHLFKIIPSNKDFMEYVSNDAHILCLRNSKPGTDEILEISVRDYLQTIPSDIAEYKAYKIDPSGKYVFSDFRIDYLGTGKYYGFEIDGNGRFLLGDGTVTHNTTGMETVCYYLKHRYPVARIFIGTEGGYRKFCRIFHPLYVSNYYDAGESKRHILRQRQCEMECGEGYPGNYAYLIYDDVSDDPVIFNSKIFRGLFKLGSQHWNQLCQVGLQYAIDMKPEIRKCVSYVAIGREPEVEERKKLYKNFGGLAGSFQNFCDLMDELTGNFTFLVFRKRSQSNNMEDNIFWLQTQNLKPWTFGCKEYREWAQKRYDKNYIEQFRM